MPVGEGVDPGDVVTQEVLDGRAPVREHLDTGADPIKGSGGRGVVHGSWLGKWKLPRGFPPNFIGWGLRCYWPDPLSTGHSYFMGKSAGSGFLRLCVEAVGFFGFGLDVEPFATVDADADFCELCIG